MRSPVFNGASGRIPRIQAGTARPTSSDARRRRPAATMWGRSRRRRLHRRLALLLRLRLHGLLLDRRQLAAEIGCRRVMLGRALDRPGDLALALLAFRHAGSERRATARIRAAI